MAGAGGSATGGQVCHGGLELCSPIHRGGKALSLTISLIWDKLIFELYHLKKCSSLLKYNNGLMRN
jgi:hypothetical protein